LRPRRTTARAVADVSRSYVVVHLFGGLRAVLAATIRSMDHAWARPPVRAGLGGVLDLADRETLNVDE
jgi:hypothetical protein